MIKRNYVKYRTGSIPRACLWIRKLSQWNVPGLLDAGGQSSKTLWQESKRLSGIEVTSHESCDTWELWTRPVKTAESSHSHVANKHTSAVSADLTRTLKIRTYSSQMQQQRQKEVKFIQNQLASKEQRWIQSFFPYFYHSVVFYNSMLT